MDLTSSDEEDDDEEEEEETPERPPRRPRARQNGTAKVSASGGSSEGIWVPVARGTGGRDPKFLSVEGTRHGLHPWGRKSPHPPPPSLSPVEMEAGPAGGAVSTGIPGWGGIPHPPAPLIPTPLSPAGTASALRIPSPPR